MRTIMLTTTIKKEPQFSVDEKTAALFTQLDFQYLYCRNAAKVSKIAFIASSSMEFPWFSTEGAACVGESFALGGPPETVAANVGFFSRIENSICSSVVSSTAGDFSH